MDENQNPFESQAVSAMLQPKEAFFNFTLIAVALTFVLALILVGSAVYNVSLWQNGARPPHQLSLKILGVQGILVMVLGLSMLIHLVATIILVVKRKRRKAGTAFIGFVFATFAIIFTQVYDRGSIFFQ